MAVDESCEFTCDRNMEIHGNLNVASSRLDAFFPLHGPRVKLPGDCSELDAATIPISKSEHWE
jgi:hypothetical protein